MTLPSKADGTDGDAQRRLSQAYVEMGDGYMDEGRMDLALEHYEKALEVSKRLAEVQPTWQHRRDLSRIFLKLGDATSREASVSRAMACYEESLRISQACAIDVPRESAAQQEVSHAYTRIGDLCLWSGDLDRARDCYDQGLKGARTPEELCGLYTRLGDVMQKCSQKTEALALYKRALGFCEQPHNDSSESWKESAIAQGYLRVGSVALQLGCVSDALEFLGKGLVVCQEAAARDTCDLELQRRLSIAYECLADVKFQADASEEAEDLYARSLEIRRNLSDGLRTDPGSLRELAELLNKYGDTLVLRNSARAASAAELYEEAFEAVQAAAGLIPTDVEVQKTLSQSWARLGNVALRSDQTERAIQCYQRSVEIAGANAANSPSSSSALREMSGSLEDLAGAKVNAGEMRSAEELCRKVVSISETLAARDADDVRAQCELASGYYHLARVLDIRKQRLGAMEAYCKANDVVNRLDIAGRLPPLWRKFISTINTAIKRLEE